MAIDMVPSESHDLAKPTYYHSAPPRPAPRNELIGAGGCSAFGQEEDQRNG